MIQDSRFDDIFSQVQSEYNVRITDSARSLIALSVRSVYQDPHPTWNNHPTFERTADRLVEDLPKHLGSLSSRCRERGRSSVSYFDVLHWIAEHLNPLGRRLGLGAEK